MTHIINNNLAEFSTSYATLSSGIPWNILRLTCILLVYTLVLIFHGTTRERCIILLYHAIVANTSNATYARRMIGRSNIIPSDTQRLSCILIGYIFSMG